MERKFKRKIKVLEESQSHVTSLYKRDRSSAMLDERIALKTEAEDQDTATQQMTTRTKLHPPAQQYLQTEDNRSRAISRQDELNNEDENAAMSSCHDVTTVDSRYDNKRQNLGGAISQTYT